MELLNRHQADRDRWHLYKKLELIPDAVNYTHSNVSNVSYLPVFSWFWRWMLQLLVDELVDQEQQVEYLERCGLLDIFGKSDKSPSSSLQRLWLLMK
ncbi:hypothetical protein [Leptothermofonsia sp. ETS-13]|uniref:hypothetical protein n=1 Tax=Leptothermofonsia sp. ETS-13 TaxID=3035696 RepID=UPI003BA33CCD